MAFRYDALAGIKRCYRVIPQRKPQFADISRTPAIYALTTANEAQSDRSITVRAAPPQSNPNVAGTYRYNLARTGEGLQKPTERIVKHPIPSWRV